MKSELVAKEEEGVRPPIHLEEATGAIYNERGVIADNYHELQALHVLAEARNAYPLPKASNESALRAVFQSVEITILNLNDVLGRAARDLAQGKLERAATKLFWVRGFHRVLVRLGVIPGQLAFPVPRDRPHGELRIADSPAFRQYVETLQEFDRVFLVYLGSLGVEVERILTERSLESPLLNLIHLSQVSNHDSTNWERDLANVAVPASVPSYAEFVVAEGMRAVVYDRTLEGDTFFTQFRGLHQVPENLGEEINDRLEETIRDVKAGRLPEALEHLRCINILLEAVLLPLPVMADCLVSSDYHDIRENLGLTSGSHSVGLRFHMFTDLYRELAETILDHLLGQRGGEGGEAGIAKALRRIDESRDDDPQVGFERHLLCDCLRFRTYLFQWREQHLHMPRNNLGGDMTKSLTGSPDAVAAVRQMTDAARDKDPLRPLLRLRGLENVAPHHRGTLTRYLASEDSLDTALLAATGEATQKRFPDVQERLGFFAQKCPFTRPPRRTAFKRDAS